MIINILRICLNKVKLKNPGRLSTLSHKLKNQEKVRRTQLISLLSSKHHRVHKMVNPKEAHKTHSTTKKEISRRKRLSSTSSSLSSRNQKLRKSKNR